MNKYKVALAYFDCWIYHDSGVWENMLMVYSCNDEREALQKAMQDCFPNSATVIKAFVLNLETNQIHVFKMKSRVEYDITGWLVLDDEKHIIESD